MSVMPKTEELKHNSLKLKVNVHKNGRLNLKV